MAEMTRISKTHLQALENEEASKLPAEVYVRGYVYQYAKVLKLNPDQVASSYLVIFKKLKSQK
jgi:cytoskeletal protein RodZ